MAARLALLISIAARAAAAQEHPALKLVLGQSAEETPAPARQDKPSQDDDFELLPPEKPPDPARSPGRRSSRKRFPGGASCWGCTSGPASQRSRP